MLKLLEKIEFKSKENKMRYIADTKIALDQYLSKKRTRSRGRILQRMPRSDEKITSVPFPFPFYPKKNFRPV